ncbi:MAG: PulJ/GspJ family protein [Planctomycetota bacterium]
MRRYKGFTLMEILLAMLITSILILGVNAAYRQAYLLWSNVEASRPAYHAARLITETLRQELACLYFPPASEQADRAGHEDSGPPFSLISLPSDETELSFFTLTPAWKGSLESSRIAKVSYRFGKDPDTGELLLDRFESPCSGEKIIGLPTYDLVAQGLADIKMFVAGPGSEPGANSWQQSYDSREAPPKALKIRLEWPKTKDTDAIEFEAAFRIICQASSVTDVNEPESPET